MKLYSNLIRILATVVVLRTETASAVSSLAVAHPLWLDPYTLTAMTVTFLRMGINDVLYGK